MSVGVLGVLKQIEDISAVANNMSLQQRCTVTE